MDLNEEFEKIKNYEGEEYFKPEVGTYKVVVVGEPELDTFIDEGGKSNDVIHLKVDVNKKVMTWTIGRGKTLGSVWGQINTLANGNNGKTTQLVFTLIVKRINNRNDYTIPEALPTLEENI